MKPFLSGRPRHDQPSLEQQAAGNSGLQRLQDAHKHGAGPGASVSGPVVECVKQGDKVVRLIVTCSCGERIEIDCQYPAHGG